MDSDPSYPAGVKSRVGFECRAGGAEPGLPCIDAVVSKPVHETRYMNSDEQDRTDNDYVINAYQCVAQPAQVRFWALATNGIPDRGQETFGGAA